MIVSTKEKIKQAALSLFANKGYAGTTMNEIAQCVGIKKASLYAHFSGKEELFFAVYEDLAADYIDLMERLMNEVETMPVEDTIYHLFEQYILYYLRNRDVQSFWNQVTFFTPPEMYDRFYEHIKGCDMQVQSKMEEIFEEGMRLGVIREDTVKKMVMSYRAMREGLLNWMMMIPEIKEQSIRAFWNDYWCGVKRREE